MGYSFAFSFSRWELWSKCPAAYKFQNIDKLPTRPSAAMTKGRDAHKAIEKFLKGVEPTMPPVLSGFTELAAGLRALPTSRLRIEEQMAFDADLRRCDYFGPNTLWRFVWDVGVISPDQREVDAVDWKTGKPADGYDRQMQVFSLPAVWLYPNLERFSGHLVYLDHATVQTVTYTRSDFENISRVWRGNASLMAADQSFLPTPSESACRWCDFSWRKNGPCRSGV